MAEVIVVQSWSVLSMQMQMPWPGLPWYTDEVQKLFEATDVSRD